MDERHKYSDLRLLFEKKDSFLFRNRILLKVSHNEGIAASGEIESVCPARQPIKETKY
jgi:hypothetical protein